VTCNASISYVASGLSRCQEAVTEGYTAEQCDDGKGLTLELCESLRGIDSCGQVDACPQEGVTDTCKFSNKSGDLSYSIVAYGYTDTDGSSSCTVGELVCDSFTNSEFMCLAAE
jgi:hypothetical protein